MVETQNETRYESGKWRAKSQSSVHIRSAFRFPSSAFTLTELLVVITIIAILAGLITAAVNALGRAKQAAITLELQQLGGAVENFKNELGAYPPNGMSNETGYTTISMFNQIQSDFERMFKKAFPRNQEPLGLIRALAGSTAGGLTGNPTQLLGGMRPSEALVFWLGGFSQDPQYPITGPGGPSFSDADGNGNNTLENGDEVLENRNLRYEFDLGRLSPRNPNGQFSGRTIQYDDPRPAGVRRQINLWTYLPQGSQIPVIYFDASRYKPEEYDPNLSDGTGDPIYAIKQLREGFDGTQDPTVGDIVFTSRDKYQILHCGTDDIWGNFISFSIKQAASGNNALGVVVAPAGPFIGNVADTLSNFMPGTLEDKQE